ncbi:hypothetical protein ABIA00_001654 [Bradyrhizobium ottawaense]
MEGPGPCRGGFSTKQSATGTNCFAHPLENLNRRLRMFADARPLRVDASGVTDSDGQLREPVLRLAKWMAVNATNGLGGGNQGSKPSPGFSTLPKDVLKKHRLKRVSAYVHDDSHEPSAAAQTKRDQRKKREKEQNIVGCHVDVPKAGRSVIQTLAAAMRVDNDLHSTISSVISSEALQEFIKNLAASELDASSISELIHNEELVRLVVACTANPTLLKSASLLVKSDANVFAALANTICAVVEGPNDPQIMLDTMAAALQSPDDTLSMIKVRHGSGLRAWIVRWALGGSSR